MALTDALLPEFDHEMAVTRTLLNRVPDGAVRLEAARQVDVAGPARAARGHPAPVGPGHARQQSCFDVAGNAAAAHRAGRARGLALFDGHVAQARAGARGNRRRA